MCPALFIWSCSVFGNFQFHLWVLANDACWKTELAFVWSAESSWLLSAGVWCIQVPRQQSLAACFREAPSLCFSVKGALAWTSLSGSVKFWRMCRCSEAVGWPPLFSTSQPEVQGPPGPPLSGLLCQRGRDASQVSPGSPGYSGCARWAVDSVLCSDGGGGTWCDVNGEWYRSGVWDRT